MTQQLRTDLQIRLGETVPILESITDAVFIDSAMASAFGATAPARTCMTSKWRISRDGLVDDLEEEGSSPLRYQTGT